MFMLTLNVFQKSAANAALKILDASLSQAWIIFVGLDLNKEEDMAIHNAITRFITTCQDAAFELKKDLN